MSQVASWRGEHFEDGDRGKMTVFFKTVQKYNDYQSKLQGRPVYEERLHIVKLVPGDKDLVIDRPIRETEKENDKLNYPQAWARFEQNRANRVPGIPIENWHSINDTQKAEFRAMNIFTIEQFANLPDSMAGKIMGFHDLRRKAEVFVESGKDAELVGKLRAEAEAKTAALEAKLKELEAMIEQMTAPKKETVVA